MQDESTDPADVERTNGSRSANGTRSERSGAADRSVESEREPDATVDGARPAEADGGEDRVETDSETDADEDRIDPGSD